MKHYTCDNCGQPMTYDEPLMQNTSPDRDAKVFYIQGEPAEGIIGNVGPEIEIRISMHFDAQLIKRAEPQRYSRSYADTERAVISRKHADICSECRWTFIQKLRNQRDPSPERDDPAPVD